MSSTNSTNRFSEGRAFKQPHENSAMSQLLAGHGVHQLRENSALTRFSEGHGFQPCRTRRAQAAALAAAGNGSLVKLCILISILTISTVSAFGQAMTQGILSPPANQRPPGLQHVGIEQHLNEQIPPDLAFRDESGKSVRLGDYFGQRPIILSLVYYKCPMLCSEVLTGLETALRPVKFDIGKDFDVLTVSFNPNDTPEMATAKKADIMTRYGRPGADQGWHFLTGPQESITALTQATGFQYEYDPKTDQYAHATAIMLLTPEGKIAQYYYGVEYAPKDLRLGLVQASQNKIGNIADEVLLYCYHYNPDTGKYGAIVSRVLKLAGGATILVLGSLLLLMFRMGSISDSAKRMH